MRYLIGLCLTLLLYISPILASSQITQSHSTAMLNSNVTTIANGHSFWLLFHIKTVPGWHAYWKNPGDSGLPPTLNWEKMPKGFSAGDIAFQPPHRIMLKNLANYGYDDNAYYLIPIHLKNALSGKHTIKTHAEWLVCEKECIPQEGNLSTSITVGNITQTNENNQLIQSLLKKLPKTINTPLNYSTTEKNILLTFNHSLVNNNKIRSAYFFPEEESIIQPAADQTLSQQDNKITLTATRDFSTPPNTMRGILMVKDSKNTHYFTISANKQSTTSTTDSIWNAILFALLGGIILNAMPCVFPILALKAFSISKSSTKSYRHNVLDGISYTAGVLICFAILAVVLIILKSFGHQVGWGYQMQSPLMITFMIYLFLLIGLNLSGYFEIGTHLMGAGNELTNKRGYTGSFFTGALAAIVATPCTAPFMGAALGYALTQPAAISLSILLSLGFGMALPLLLISVIPMLGRLLPKPGAWMETFKELLAFPMFVSMVWLLWVLVQQTTPEQELYVMLGLIMTAFSIWLWQKVAPKKIIIKTLLWATLVVTSTYPIYTIYQYEKNGGETSTELSQPFSPEKLDVLLKEKKPVFVNMTAAWCLTCKYNEGAYFSTKKFKDLLKDNNITYLKGDWTNRNTTILNYLKSFNRSGVPLYVFYDTHGKAHMLPQLLSNKILFDALSPKTVTTSKK